MQNHQKSGVGAYSGTTVRVVCEYSVPDIASCMYSEACIYRHTLGRASSDHYRQVLLKQLGLCRNIAIESTS